MTRPTGLWIIALLIFVGRSSAGRTEDLYNLVFQYGALRLTVPEISHTLAELHSMDPYPMIPRLGAEMTAEDMRKIDINYWHRAGELDVSKCTFNYIKSLRSTFQKLKHRAEKLRHQGRFFGNVLNLDKYFNHLLTETTSFCSKHIPLLLHQLEEATEYNYEDLNVLTREIRDEFSRLSPYEVGRQVGEFIITKADPPTIRQLSQSLDTIEAVKRTYERLSPCQGVLHIVDRHREFYDLITKLKQFKLGNFVFTSGRTETGRDNMASWVSRITVCLYIRDNDQIYHNAIEHLVQTEQVLRWIASAPTGAQVPSSDERYYSIFRHGYRKMEYPYIKAALLILDSQEMGLPEKDPRRQEVSFWLEAAVDNELKCHAGDDEMLRSNLVNATTRASQIIGAVGVTLNIETYAKHVRAKRFTYCDFTIGPYLSNRVSKWIQSRHSDIQAFTSGYWRTSIMNPIELGRRVGRLIYSKLDTLTFEHLVQSLLALMDAGLVRTIYEQHSPCYGLLQIVDDYKKFFSLISLPENFHRLNYKMKSWLDKVAVCRFVEENEQVFVQAGFYLVHIRAKMHQTQSIN